MSHSLIDTQEAKFVNNYMHHTHRSNFAFSILSKDTSAYGLEELGID